MVDSTRAFADLGPLSHVGRLLVTELLTGPGVATLFVGGDPNGNTPGVLGQLAVDATTGNVYQNVDNDTTWLPFASSSSPSGVFPITSYGAVAGVATEAQALVNDAAFDAAAAAALAAGGGTVYVPRGVFYVTRSGAGPWCVDVPGDDLIYEGAGRNASVVRMLAGQPASSTVMFRVNGRTNVQFRSMTLDGNWGAVVGVTTTQAGINQGTQVDPQNHLVMLRGADDIVITDVMFTQAYGDGVWMGANANDDLTDITRNATVQECAFYVVARNAITFGAPVHGVFVDRCSMSVVFTTCVDSEPQGLFDGARDVVITRNTMSGWWNGQFYNLLISVVGGYPTAPNLSAAARAWRIEDNTIHGSINVFSASNIVIARNTLTTSFSDAAYAIAPVLIDHWCDDITVVDNYIYDNTPVSVASGDPHNGAISVQLYASGNNNQQPAGVRVKGNRVHARQGTRGIWVNAPGGFSIGDGTPVVAQYNGALSTGVTDNTLEDSGAAWTVNQWAGWRVITGGVVAVIVSNTATVLTLEPSYPVLEPVAWFTPTGDRAATPAIGSYAITSWSGVVDIEANDIDCGQDGNAAGGEGIYLFNDRAGIYVRVRDNNVKNPQPWGLIVISAASKPPLLVEVKGNRFLDDRGSAAAMSAAMRFPSAADMTAIAKRIISDNGVVRSAAAVMSLGSGGTTETWLLADGPIEAWAGWGAPGMTAPNGSTYQRLDGGAGTTYYVRVAAAWVGIA